MRRPARMHAGWDSRCLVRRSGIARLMVVARERKDLIRGELRRLVPSWGTLIFTGGIRRQLARFLRAKVISALPSCWGTDGSGRPVCLNLFLGSSRFRFIADTPRTFLTENILS